MQNVTPITISISNKKKKKMMILYIGMCLIPLKIQYKINYSVMVQHTYYFEKLVRSI